MQDGRTRKLRNPGQIEPFDAFLRRRRASLVVISGANTGAEHALEAAHMSIGRGPGVDVALDDTTMSRAHAAVEYADGGFRVRDLGSTNGTFVNGGAVASAALKHGDRVQLGGHVLQYVEEERAHEPRTYALPEA